MVLTEDENLSLGELSLTLRTALNMAFIGTSEAACAAKFVEQYVPYGVPLSEEARQKIVWIINRLELQIFPVFARDRLFDDLAI